MHDPHCCVSEEDFQENIGMSKEAKAKWMGKDQKERDEDAGDPIGEADKAGKRKYMEADVTWLRAARMDHTAIFYLDERAKTCYKLRTQLQGHNAVVNCFKDSFRQPLDCECDIRKYLSDVMLEKKELAAEIAKHGKPNKKGGKKSQQPK